MGWTYLLIASVFEISWAMALKYSDGLSRLFPTVIVVIGGLLSFYFLAQGVKSLPIGTAYAVWTGIGAVGTVILGIILLGESRDLPRLIFIMFILVGIVGLKFTSQ